MKVLEYIGVFFIGFVLAMLLVAGMLAGCALSDGRFVDRVEAYRVAQDAGQILPRRLGGGPRLFSEDVW